MKCGELGHRTQSGKLCGYPVIAGQAGCPHHDGSGRAKEFQRKGSLVRQLNQLPQNIQAGKLGTIEEIRQVYVDLLNATMTQKNLERSRLEIAVKILSGASNLLQVDAMRELADILLQIEGKGKALMVLESMKAARLRPIPVPLSVSRNEKSSA
jgi:hypothetical protein